MPQTQTSMDTALSTIPPTGDNTSDALLSKLNQREEQFNTQIEGLAKEEKGVKMPEPPKLTQAPDSKDYTTSPVEAFGSAASVLGAWGALLTKHPMQAALNSGAGVLNAYHQKDTANFTKAMEKWKADTENAWKMADWQQNLYEDMLKRPESEARILAMGAKDTAALAAINSRTLTNAAKMQAAATQKLSVAMEKHDETAYRTQEYIKEGMPEGAAHMKAFDEVWNTSAEKAKEKEKAIDDAAKFDFSKAKPNDPVPGTGNTVGSIIQAGDAIHGGTKPSQLGLGYGMNPTKKAVENYVAWKYPNFDMALAQKDYQAAVAAEKSSQVQTAKIQLASHILDESIPSLIDITQKYQLSPSTDLNKIYNFINTHASSDDKTNFSTQLRAVTTDYAQFIGRGRQTVHSDEEALKILNENMGISSLKGFQKAVETEQKNVKRGIDKAKEEREGGSTAKDVFNDGEAKEHPLDIPADKKLIIGKWYSTPQGVGKYKGNGEFDE